MEKNAMRIYNVPEKLKTDFKLICDEIGISDSAGAKMALTDFVSKNQEILDKKKDRATWPGLYLT